MPAIVPEGYTQVREAIYALALARHAGVDFSQAVKDVREHGFQDTRFTREELECSAEAFWAEVGNERLPVWTEHLTSGGVLHIAPQLLKDVPCLRSYNVGDLSYLRPNHLLSFQLRRRFPPRPGQSFPDWASRFQLLVRDSDLQQSRAKIRQTRKRNRSAGTMALSSTRPP